MAIRERKGRASPWQCYWNNPLTGKRECANFATRHDAEKHDSLIKHRLKFDRESFKVEESEETPAQELTLEGAYLLYLREKQFNKKSLQWQMDAMRLPLRKMGDIPLDAITAEQIANLMEEHGKRVVKAATIHNRMSVLCSVLRWCMSNGFMPELRFPKLPPKRYEHFIPQRQMNCAPLWMQRRPHIIRVIVLGAQCGVRVGPSELFRLTWADVDLSRGVLRVHGAKKNPNIPWREVPIRESLLSLFETWQKDDLEKGIEHLIHHNGQPVSSIKNAWKQTLQRAGITRRIRPYDLRHAFATELIAGGVDVGTVAKLMGHSTPTMLLTHYQHVMDKQKRTAVEALPDIGHVPKGMCPKNKAVTAMQ